LMAGKAARPWAAHPMQLALGFIVWSIWFVVLYGGLSVACALAMPPIGAGSMNWLNASLLLLTLATIALLMYWSVLCWQGSTSIRGQKRRTSRFISQVSAGLHAMAAGAALAVGLPALVLPPCI
jgi:hypothetical protein